MPLPTKFDLVPLMAWEAEYGLIPDDYVTVDIESTGVDISCDLPLQIGWCVVKGRKAVLETSVLIDWTRTLSQVEIAALAVRIEATRQRMAEKGKSYPWTLEMLRARGVSPAEAVGRLSCALGEDPAVAAHYGFLLDYPVLGRTFERVGYTFAPDVNRMLDTGLMIKACLVGLSPVHGESLPTYVKRLSACRTGVKHNLEAVVGMFDLRVGAGVQSGRTHAAAYDAWIVHLLIECLRGQVHPPTKLAIPGRAFDG